MRTLSCLVMVLLAVVSILEGNVALALLFGGIKALIVGLGYMELREAARAHLLAYASGVAALTGVLVLLVRTA